MRSAILAATAVIVMPYAAAAQDAPQPPAPVLPRIDDFPIKPLRSDEDYARLAGQDDLRFPLSLKYVPLDHADGVFASFGGEYRLKSDSYFHPDFGRRNAADFTSIQQRFLLHTDLHLGRDVRLFVQLGAGTESGRLPGPRAGDRGDPDLAQAFVDIGFGAPAHRWRLRIGRQEVALGRYVAIRETTNFRRTFDGARIDGAAAGFTLTGLAARVTRNKTGAFDDDAAPGDHIYLLQADHALPLKGLRVGMIAYQRVNRQATYLAGQGLERRRSLGVRIFGGKNGWDMDGQISYQFGRFAPIAQPSLTIRAWGGALESGYTLAEKWKPRLAFRVDIAGGDANSNDARLTTFDLPYPNLSYLTDAALFAPRNVRDIQPFVTISPTTRFSLTAGAQFLWRTTTADAVYSPVNIQILRPGGTAHYVATQPYARVTWHMNHFVDLQASAVHAMPGKALEDMQARKALDYVAASASVRF
ncbi:MAG: alginate export family protein [Sphingomonas sp.]|nr:alginate export family protein [Sphingomonas sp.]